MQSDAQAAALAELEDRFQCDRPRLWQAVPLLAQPIAPEEIIRQGSMHLADRVFNCREWCTLISSSFRYLLSLNTHNITSGTDMISPLAEMLVSCLVDSTTVRGGYIYRTLADEQQDTLISISKVVGEQLSRPEFITLHHMLQSSTRHMREFRKHIFVRVENTFGGNGLVFDSDWIGPYQEETATIVTGQSWRELSVKQVIEVRRYEMSSPVIHRFILPRLLEYAIADWNDDMVDYLLGTLEWREFMFQHLSRTECMCVYDSLVYCSEYWRRIFPFYPSRKASMHDGRSAINRILGTAKSKINASL